ASRPGTVPTGGSVSGGASRSGLTSTSLRSPPGRGAARCRPTATALEAVNRWWFVAVHVVCRTAASCITSSTPHRRRPEEPAGPAPVGTLGALAGAVGLPAQTRKRSSPPPPRPPARRSRRRLATSPPPLHQERDCE